MVTTAFKQSSAATADLKSMLASMPPSLAQLSQGFLSGNVSLTEYRKATRGMGADGAAMGAQFMALAAKAHGFNDMVKAGNPAAVTFAQYLKQMMGGATGLNTALMLTGNSAHYFTSATNQVAAAGAHAGKNIDTWAATSKTAAVQFAQMRQGIDVLGIKIGTWLIPKVEDLVHALTTAVGWLEKHKTVALILAGAIGGVLVLAIGAWAASMWAAATAALGLESGLLPIILIAAAIGVAVLLLATHWRQVWGAIKVAFDAVWTYYIKPQWEAMQVAWQVLWLAMQAVYNDVILPVFNFIKNNWQIVLGVITGGLSFLFTNWKDIWGGIRTVYDAVILPIFRGIETAWNAVWGALRASWNAARTIFSDIGGAFGWVGGVVHSVLSGIRSIWDSIWNGISAATSGALSTMKSILNDIIGLINQGIGLINDLIHAANDATGGVSDLWSWTGLPSIPKIPDIPTIPYLAEGAIVTRPTLAIFGEAGPEAVIPLNRPAAVAQFATAAAGMTPAALPVGTGSAAGSGEPSVIELHVYLDGKEIQANVETHQLRQGLRRGGSHTYQQFSKGR